MISRSSADVSVTVEGSVNHPQWRSLSPAFSLRVPAPLARVAHPAPAGQPSRCCLDRRALIFQSGNHPVPQSRRRRAPWRSKTRRGADIYGPGKGKLFCNLSDFLTFPGRRTEIDVARALKKLAIILNGSLFARSTGNGCLAAAFRLGHRCKHRPPRKDTS